MPLVAVCGYMLLPNGTPAFGGGVLFIELMQGVNVEQTVALADFSGLPVIASGGVTDLGDVERLKPYAQIEGIITGRAIYEGTLDIAQAQALLDT